MIEWTYRTLVVPAYKVEFARLLTSTLAGASGEGMWTTLLSPTGSLPATHYISSGMLSTEFASLLALQEVSTEDTGDITISVISAGQPEYVATAVSELGVEVTSNQISGLYLESDITEQDPHSVMARLGLQMIQPEDNQVE